MAEQKNSLDKATASIPTNDLYDEYLPYWTKLARTPNEDVVKSLGVEFLSATSGMVADGMNTGQSGLTRYSIYKNRARYPSYRGDTEIAMSGLLWNKPAEYIIPEKLQPIEKNATPDGDSLSTLHRRVNEKQINPSRIGCLLDVPDGTDGKGLDVYPRILEYCAPAIKNWIIGKRKDTGTMDLMAVLLDESGLESNGGFIMVQKPKARICALQWIDGKYKYYTQTYDESGFALFSTMDFDAPGDVNYPAITGGTEINFIPFAVCNAQSVEFDPEFPMMLGLTNECLAYYRSSADYENAKHYSSQPTLMFTGIDSKTAGNITVGSTVAIVTDKENAKGFYIETEGNGIPSLEQSVTNSGIRCQEMGVNLLKTGANESGEALGIRVKMQTASISTIAETGAIFIEKLLQMAGRWMGLSDDDIANIEVKPNADFGNIHTTIKELVEAWGLVVQGGMTEREHFGLIKRAGISKQDYDDRASEIDIQNTDRSNTKDITDVNE